MKANIVWGLVPVALLVSLPAQAHFKVQEPADALMTNATGDPTGGNQKTAPCGTGTTASNMVTQVRAGSKLHVKVLETIVHGGHYRVAIASDRNALVTPTPVITNNNCVSAPIQTVPVSPVVADGLFPHADVGGPQTYETDVNVPTALGAYTVQIIEFMTPHAPPCFYFHCANIQVVEADAGTADGGVLVIDGGGGSSGGTGTTDAGDPPPDEGDGTSSSGGNSRLRSSSTADDGCNVGSSTTPSVLTMSVFGLMAFGMLRRRRRA
jgi:uncharacterized protein (TIGR03382 family)